MRNIHQEEQIKNGWHSLLPRRRKIEENTQRYPSGKEETIEGRFVVTGIRSPGIVAHPRTATPGSTGWKNTHTKGNIQR
jgi:hypothetical protein